MSKASFVYKSFKVLIKRRQGGNRLKTAKTKTSTHPPQKPQNPNLVLKTERMEGTIETWELLLFLSPD